MAGGGVSGTSIYAAPWAGSIASSQCVKQASSQRALAVANAQICEDIFEDGVVPGVVDDEGAVCSCASTGSAASCMSTTSPLDQRPRTRTLPNDQSGSSTGSTLARRSQVAASTMPTKPVFRKSSKTPVQHFQHPGRGIASFAPFTLLSSTEASNASLCQPRLVHASRGFESRHLGVTLVLVT